MEKANVDYNREKAARISALLELGQDLHLMAAARKQGGDTGADFLSELLAKPTRLRVREALGAEAEDLDDAALEAKALAVYEDYSQLVQLMVQWESFRDELHTHHKGIQLIEQALNPDQKVICFECLGTSAKHLMASGVAVTPW